MPTQLNALCQTPRLHLAWNTVKAKGSAGGIDGISIDEFEHNKRIEIPKLAKELKAGTWKPQPYMEIEVAKTKNPDEMRKLGMTAIRDKHYPYNLSQSHYARIGYIPPIKKKEPVKIVVI